MSQPSFSPVASEPLARSFGAFLTALADPEGGPALLALHAEAAVVLEGGRGVRRGAADPAAFAAAHRAAAGAGPRYGAAALRAVREDAGALIANFDLTVEGLDEPVPVAAGFREEAGAWRLAWTVADPAAELTFALGEATMLSLFPFLGRPWLASPRAWLDVAIARARLAPDPGPLHTLEGARFSCDGSTQCCKFDWSIHLPREAQDFLDAIPWDRLAPELAGTQLEVLPSGQLELKARGEACRFLDAQGRCRLHAQFGTPVFSACTTFPFTFAETPEGIDVAASFFCGSVRSRLGLPLAEREADLRARLAQGGAKRAEAFRIGPDREVPWEAFRDAEHVLRQVLRLGHLPLRRRLWMGTRVLEAWMTGGRMNYLGWEREPLEPLEDIEQAFAQTLLQTVFDGAAVSLPELPPGQAFQVAGGEVRDTETMVGWFENILFSKELSYPFDLSTAFNMLVVLYLIVRELERVYDGPVPERAWRSVTAFVTHGGLTHMLETLFAEIPDLKEPMGTPTYGMLFLRCGVEPD